MDTTKIDFAYLVTISKIGTDNVRQIMSNIGFQSKDEAHEYFNERVKANDEMLNSDGFKLLNKDTTEDWVVYTFTSEGYENYQYKRIIELTRLPFKFI